MRFTEDVLPLGALVGPPTLSEARALGEGRALVRGGALPLPWVEELLAAARRLEARGALTPAGVGRDGHLDPRVRSDRTTWVEPDGGGEPALAAVWGWFDQLRLALVEATWVSMPRFAVQLACYPGGGSHYARHVDALPGDPNRVITAIVYLNPAWAPGDGGALRAWEPDGVRELAPLAGRLVVFRSEVLPHAVLPVWAERWAVAAWYRGAEPVPMLADPGIAPGGAR